jgi:hypothetical protein
MKMTSMILLKHRKDNGIAVYLPKGTMLKEMQPKLSKLSQHFFFDLVQELSDTPHTIVASNRGYFLNSPHTYNSNVTPILNN